MNYYARLTKTSISKLREIFSRMQCLGFVARVRDGKSSSDSLCRSNLTLEIKFEPHVLSFPRNATYIILGIMECFNANICPNCRPKVFLNLDFSILSNLSGFPERRNRNEDKLHNEKREFIKNINYKNRSRIIQN